MPARERGWKWCNGPCGRDLPVSEFYLNTAGNPQPECKACHRVKARDNFRKNYRERIPNWQRERKRQRQRYWSNAEYREHKKAQARAYKRRAA
jgi:hypothetical protein